MLLKCILLIYSPRHGSNFFVLKRILIEGIFKYANLLL